MQGLKCEYQDVEFHELPPPPCNAIGVVISIVNNPQGTKLYSKFLIDCKAVCRFSDQGRN